MLRRLVSEFLRQRPGDQVVFGSRSIWSADYGDRDAISTAESLLRHASTLHLESSPTQHRCLSTGASSVQNGLVRATGCRSFSVRAEPKLTDGMDESDRHMSSTLRKALASHYPPAEDHQVQPVLVASMTKLLCEPPAPQLASRQQASQGSAAPCDRGGGPDIHSVASEEAVEETASSDMSAEPPANRELARKQAAYRYGAAQRERYKAGVAKSRSTRPQQDFTRYHEKLKAEATAARSTAQVEERILPPAHSAEALQELASAVASVLYQDEHEVMTLLQNSAYGRAQAPAPLPDIDQARASLQEMLRIFAAITKFSAVRTVWVLVLGRIPLLLSCTVDQMRSAVSFLEMLDMKPAQIAVCLTKAPVLLVQNLEEKLLPLCDYLNSIGLDLRKQRTLVTWRPEVLSQRLDRVKGQCALLAGYGIQGEVLAKVLYKSSNLIVVPRVNLALRLKYLYGELGCTPEDIRLGAGIVGFEAPFVARRVAWLKHLGREVQIPSQVPGGHEGWKNFVDRLREKGRFGPGEPIPLWVALRWPLKWLCAMLEVDFKEAQAFEREWRSSEEAKRWAGIPWREKGIWKRTENHLTTT